MTDRTWLPGDPCPRCDALPVEVTTLSEPRPQHLAACSCYPHPPLCISCRGALGSSGTCERLGCPVAGRIQPDPCTDPLWPTP